ncbi:hypothetical protein IWZ01DRAFT_135451 [Phyllosticta capitalensis]
MSERQKPVRRQKPGLGNSRGQSPPKRPSPEGDEAFPGRVAQSTEVLSQEPEPVVKREGEPLHRDRPAKRHKPSFLELHKTPIQIFVTYDGSSGASFHTHIELISYYSRFFRLQFSVKRESTQHHVLEDVHPDEFAIFYRWMESKHLFEDEADRKEWKMLSLAKLHNTAMRIEAPMFANVILEAIHGRIVLLTQSDPAGRTRKFDSSLKTIKWITHEVPMDCRLFAYAREYMAFFYLIHVPELRAESLEQFPAPFLIEVLFTLRDAMHRLSPISGTRPVLDGEGNFHEAASYISHFIDLIMVMAGAMKCLIKANPTKKFANVDTLCHYHVHERQDPPSKRCAKPSALGLWEDMASLLEKKPIDVQVIE